MKTKHNIKYSGLWFILFLVLAYRDSARATQGYEVSGYFVYSVFAGTGDPVYKEERLFYVKVGFPEWLIRTEPLEEKKNGVGYWEVCNTTNGEIIALTGLAAAYDPDKSPLKSIRATVKELEETNLGFNSKTPIFHPNSSSGSNTNYLDNVAVARHFIGNIPPADSSFASFLWFAYTKQTGLKGTSTEGDLLPQIWDSGKPVDHQMHHVVWSNFENAPYLIKSALFKWSGVDSQTDGSEIKLGSSINSSNPEATYQVYSATNLAELTLPLHFELTRFAPVRSISDQPKKLTSIVASVVSVSLIESPSALTIEPPGKTVVSDYRFATKQTLGNPFSYSVTTNLSPETNGIIASARYQAFVKTQPPSPSKPISYARRRIIILIFIALTILPLIALIMNSRKKK